VAGIVAFDAVLAMRYMSRSRAENMVEQLGPVRGIPAARRALALADPQSESPLESWGRAQIVTAEVPVLEGKYRLDLLLNGHVAVELHGEIKYDGQSTGVDPVVQMKRDRERERLLQNAGFSLVHATYADLAEGRLVELVRAGLVRQVA
jgi:hypothetical protein